MNLAIEYLVRTGAIKNFLEIPCSLFVENVREKISKVLIIKEDLDRSCAYQITQWHLDCLKPEEMLPICDMSFIDKNDVFVSDKVILPGFSPLPYVEQPVATNKNVFNHPMDKIDYAYFFNNYLNSLKHRMAKSDWIWRAFVWTVFGSILTENHFALESWERRTTIDKEQAYVKARFQNRWFQWTVWKNEFLIAESVAPELVFHNAYLSRRAA
jgi:hypothetical protein